LLSLRNLFSEDYLEDNEVSFMSGDMQLKQHVEDELSWEPSLDATAIGVTVKGAIVTISGHVTTFTEKQAAEKAVLRIRGVRALANELEVKLPTDSNRTDEDIARAAVSIFTWHPSIPKDRIKIQVSHGLVTLEGTVDWHYQRTAAELAVEDLMGVKGVNDRITVIAAPASAEVKSQIEAALRRNAEVDASRIGVAIQGNTVILTGTVASMSEKIAAEQAAWKSWGVGWVENAIKVSIFSKTETAV
jgi:osmotically-inducible protein OsmY